MDSNEIIDFSSAQISDRAYPNSALRKEPVIFNGEYYLVKYPVRNNKKTHPAQVSSYMNNSISEFAGCHIFESLDIDTQETFIVKRDNLLGVACKDFKFVSSIMRQRYTHLYRWCEELPLAVRQLYHLPFFTSLN